jgi:DNA adenine methylase
MLGDSRLTKCNVQPFLRWAGSKRQLIPILSGYWDYKYSRYVEPFAGSASLFFSLSPPRALLGDINIELMATYKQVKHNVKALLSDLSTMKKGRRNYLRLRALDPLFFTPSMRAARFIYLNRFCFNGLYRTNREGRFNVPYGGDRSGRIPSNDLLLRCSSSLKRTELAVGSFEATLEKVKPGDFVYMDPPFSIKAKRVFNEYDVSIFGLEDLYRLRKWMVRLDHENVHFLVSYAESEEADLLRDGFHTEVVVVRRNIAGFTERRKPARELLISNRRPRK